MEILNNNCLSIFQFQEKNFKTKMYSTNEKNENKNFSFSKNINESLNFKDSEKNQSINNNFPINSSEHFNEEKNKIENLFLEANLRNWINEYLAKNNSFPKNNLINKMCQKFSNGRKKFNINDSWCFNFLNKNFIDEKENFEILLSKKKLNISENKFFFNFESPFKEIK